MAYEFIRSPNFWPGRTKKITRIVIHWWGDPAAGYTIQGVINTFQNPARQASAHYVVSDTRIVQMVKEADTAWHAGNRTFNINPESIGIEINPRLPGATYETVGRLVREIRSRHGNIPLIRHRDVPGASTACPGTVDLARIDKIANNEGGSTVATVKDMTHLNALSKELVRKPATTSDKEWVGRTLEALFRNWIFLWQRRYDGLVKSQAAEIAAKDAEIKRLNDQIAAGGGGATTDEQGWAWLRGKING